MLSFRVAEDGMHLVQADPVIELSDNLLANAASNDLFDVVDGVAIFHLVEGEIAYHLHDYDDLHEAWVAVRMDVEDEED